MLFLIKIKVARGQMFSTHPNRLIESHEINSYHIIKDNDASPNKN
jgi:hypothetical protein